MPLTIESLLNPIVDGLSSKAQALIAENHENIRDSSVEIFPRRSSIYLLLNNDVIYPKDDHEIYASAVDNNDRLCSANESVSSIQTAQPIAEVGVERINLVDKIRHVLDIIDIGSIVTELDPKSAYRRTSIPLCASSIDRKSLEPISPRSLRNQRNSYLQRCRLGLVAREHTCPCTVKSKLLNAGPQSRYIKYGLNFSKYARNEDKMSIQHLLN